MRKKLDLSTSTSRYLLIVIVVILLVSISMLARDIKKIEESYYQMGVSSAKTLHESIVMTRSWNAKVVGVYAPVSEYLQPNPYLVDPLRDLHTEQGLTLTKINPAFMTRLISEIMEIDASATMKISSLEPLNPSNIPDAWERANLKKFDSVKSFSHTLQTIDGELFVRYIAPLVTEESCLACHAVQGYKVGDIRGAISTKIPYASYYEALTIEKRNSIITYLLLVFGSVLAISFFGIKQIRVEQQLLEAKQKADHASQLKGEFLANMSHELRTPMNIIVGMTEMLSESELNRMQKEQIEMVQTSSQHLLTIINDILDYTRIEAGEMSINISCFNLLDRLEQTIRMFDEQLKRNRINMDLQVTDNIPSNLCGDYDKLNQVLVNLIANAIKFTDAGNINIEVQLIARDQDKVQLQFSVIDTGIGIEAAKINDLFQRFSQLDSSKTRKYEGSGLGLAISKKLIETMGGKIWVESEVGVGSTFSFEVELLIAQDSELQQVINKNNVTIDLVDDNDKKLKILVVEDKAMNRKMLKVMLEKRGWQVDIAVDGLEAVEAYKNKKYDVVLMDIQMPNMDGLTATKIIRDYELEMNIQRTPIIAVTAKAMNEDKQECLGAGMDDFIAKPIVTKQLYTAIESGTKLTKN